jgi:hypothetical protein
MEELHDRAFEILGANQIAQVFHRRSRRGVDDNAVPTLSTTPRQRKALHLLRHVFHRSFMSVL